MKLFSYWRSSAAYRVRIALNLKGLAYETVAVSLIAEGGQQHAAAYTALNPQKLVPTLVLDDGTALTQSLAIIDYLDALVPAPALLPADPLARAQVLSVAHAIAMDIHPLNNLRVMSWLAETYGADESGKIAWMQHWMQIGFAPLETMVKPGPFAFGDSPSLADICLVPQIYNARRWGLDMTLYPKLAAIEAACLALPTFAHAAPEAQPDAA
jgi:maleylacetoacetate isomerase/maleylpyruvate isomerase